MDDVIINAALTGMVPRREDSPHVPLTPAEAAADARRCVAAGASILHLHARGPSGEPSSAPEAWQELLAAVRAAAPEALLCVSTSGREATSVAARAVALEQRGPPPDLASLTLGSLNFPRQAVATDPSTMVALAERMAQRGIKPECECFEIGHAETAAWLLDRGLLQPPVYANLLLGNPGTASASLLHLGVMVGALPAGSCWSAAGLGRAQTSVAMLALAAGGHVRIGLEDNLWLDPQRTQLATNAGLIDRVVRLASELGRQPASPAVTRALLGCPAR